MANRANSTATDKGPPGENNVNLTDKQVKSKTEKHLPPGFFILKKLSFRFKGRISTE